MELRGRYFSGCVAGLLLACGGRAETSDEGGTTANGVSGRDLSLYVDVLGTSPTFDFTVAVPLRSGEDTRDVVHPTASAQEVACVDSLDDGSSERIEVWFEPEVPEEHARSSLSYVRLTFLLDGYQDFELFVEHAGGSIVCPTRPQDALVSIEEGLATCPVFGEPEPGFSPEYLGYELCPCEVVGGPVLGSEIQRVGIRAQPDPSSSSRFDRYLCVARRAALCFDDCPWERAYFEQFK